MSERHRVRAAVLGGAEGGGGSGTIDHSVDGDVRAVPGASVSLLVLTPLSSTSYQIDSFDTQTLPTPLPMPSGSTITFTPATPVDAPAGTVLGLYGGTPGGAECVFSGGPGDQYIAGGPFGVPANGETYTFIGTPSTGERLNVAANLLQTVDAGLTIAAHPTVATAGGIGAFTFSLTNTGVSTGTASFSDSIPNGLSIVSAVAGSGSAARSPSWFLLFDRPAPPGAMVIVFIQASASSPTLGRSRRAQQTRTPANNAATSSLDGRRTGKVSCHVIALKRLPLAVAGSVLAALSGNGAVENPPRRASPRAPWGTLRARAHIRRAPK